MNNELYVVSFECAGQVCVYSLNGRPVFHASKSIAVKAARSIFERAYSGKDGPIALLSAVLLDLRIHTAGDLLTKLGPGIKLWNGTSGIIIRGRSAKAWHSRGDRPYPLPKGLRRLTTRTKHNKTSLTKACHGR